MRPAALTALVVLLLAVTTPASAAPAVADLDVAVPTEVLLATDEDGTTVNLTIQAQLGCTVGWEAPAPVHGALRGFVRDDGTVHEFARAPFAAAWTDLGDGSFAIDQRLALEMPTDGDAFAPGDNEVVVQFLPDQPREPARRCHADGYRIDPAEETFLVTVSDSDAAAQMAVDSIQKDDRFHAIPMLLALTLVGLLALFAFRRQRHG